MKTIKQETASEIKLIYRKGQHVVIEQREDASVTDIVIVEIDALPMLIEELKKYVHK